RSLAAAASIASGSRSIPISRASPPTLSRRSSACPPPPTVPSTYTPPLRGLKYSRTSALKTGTCLNDALNVPHLDSEVHDLLGDRLEGRLGLLHVRLPRLLRPELDPGRDADHHDILFESRILPQGRGQHD